MSKKSAQKKDKNYCNILDNLYKLDDGKEIMNTLAELCLTNMFTHKAHTKNNKVRPKTFMMNKSMGKKTDDFKRSLFIGFYSKEGLAKIAKKDEPMIYNILGEGYKVVVKNNEIHIGSSKIKKEIPASNGMLLVLDSPLKSGTKKMKGGSTTYKVRGSSNLQVKHPLLERKIVYYDDLNPLRGINLRWNILEHYRRQWPVYDWTLTDDFNYYNWAYASLITYLTEQIPNFFTLYEPFPDPLIGLESLLQYRLLDTSGYLIPDSLLLGFYNSPYWLSTDPSIIDKAKVYLGGESHHKKGGGFGLPIIYQDTVVIEDYMKPYKDSLRNVLKDANIPERKKRMYIVDIYKKLENDDEFRGNEGRNIMKRVGSQIHMVTLGRHLDAFMTYNIRNYLSLPMSGGKSEEIKGGGGEYSLYNPSLFDEVRCLFGTAKYPDLVDLVLQPNLDSGYRFGMDFINKFCLSPYCLYVSGLSKNLGLTTLKTPYIKRAHFKNLGYKQPNKDTVVIRTKTPTTPTITPTTATVSTSSSGTKTDSAQMAYLLQNI